jgi:hypothetical protein
MLLGVDDTMRTQKAGARSKRPKYRIRDKADFEEAAGAKVRGN